jgi:hypothetical protein
MLLAGAVDFGRAYYTAVVVEQMAGEGAAYAATYPDRDLNFPAPNSCSLLGVQASKSIQERARNVARERGMVIDPGQATITILRGDGSASPCSSRCTGTSIQIKVTYRIDDLFLPGLLGMRNITVTRSATQVIMRNAYGARSSCS